MASLPTAPTPPRLPAQFFTVLLNGQEIGGALNFDVREMFEGQYVPIIGSTAPVWEPGMRHGTGTFESFWTFGGDIEDLMIAAQVASAQDVATAGVDFRWFGLVATGAYNDGQRSKTITIHGLQLTERGLRAVQADRNLHESGTFAFTFITEQ